MVLGATVGLAVAASLPGEMSWALRIVAGWDAGSGLLLVMIWFLILAGDPVATRCRAAAADPGHTVVWVIVLGASALSLFAGAGLMRHAKRIAPEAGTLLVCLSLVAVIAAWFLTHTSFTLRYAHLYYRDDDEGEGGLSFPGDRKPDDFDFAYFAFTVGMCFQVSDVTVSSPQIRRADASTRQLRPELQRGRVEP
ncbi:MAG TPA: DUF1345 domain-containing protein [Polyangiaceae bacterium]|nr:DUF1345 domain-containing protein [Polyangiaceae bacterium]